MRLTIASLSILFSIGLTCWLLFKAGMITIWYCIAFATTIFFAFFSGYLIQSMETGSVGKALDDLKARYNELLKEYERGKAEAANNAATPANA